ncbi:ribonuclease H-like domain-containing protein [Tanacetum coccineum]
MYDTCNRCGIGHIPLQCLNRDPSTLRTWPSANFTNTRTQSSNTSANWYSDTRANSHMTPNLEAMDNSKAYYGDDALHVGNDKGLPILHIGSSKVYSPQKTFSIKNILHVPEISHSLLFVQKFCLDNDVLFVYPGSDKQPTLRSKVILSFCSIGGVEVGIQLMLLISTLSSATSSSACSDLSSATAVKPIFSTLQERQEHGFSRLRHSKNYVIQNSNGTVPPSKMIPRRLVLHSLGFIPVLFNIPLIAEALEMKEPDVIRSQKLDSGVRIQDKVDGEGPKAREGDLVEVNYDAKSLWEAIKNRFGGNKESKKMQKTILKQNYENFAASCQEGLDKTYDRFQKLISQFEIYGEVISQEDANMKLLRSLPSAWNNIALILGNKSNLDTLAWMEPRNQGNRNRDAPRRNALVDTSTTNALVVQDGIGGYDWSFQDEEGITNFALMAYTSQALSSSSSSDSKVNTCSKDCLKSYETLQKQYDQQRNALNKSNLEIIGYQMGLESLKARIVIHEKNEAVYEEDIAFLKYDVQAKDISIKDLKNYAKDKTGLGYDYSQMNESEVVHSVFNSRESDVGDSPVNDRFKIGEGFHAVPPPYTGNYMPSRPYLSFAGLDNSVYKTKVSETKTSISKTSKDIVEKPKTVRPSAPIIEEWDTNSGQVPVNAAKQNSLRATTSISTARTVNTATPKPKVNVALPITYSYFKAHSLVRRAFNQKLAAKTNNFNEKVNTVRIWRPIGNVIDHTSKDSGSYMFKRFDYVDLQARLKHMTGNKSFLPDYQEIDGGFVFFDLEEGGLTCLFAKATIYESNLWHRRLGHINFKTMNKLVRGTLVRGLPSKLFENDHTCVACQKGKQHKVSCKTKLVEAVNTACYVQNKVLVTKPHNKTPYELLHGRPTSISFMRPFGCLVTILNTLDPLGKFDRKADEGFLVGYSINSKAFRVFNTRTRKVEENLHITFLENKPNVVGSGLDWLFDIDLLTNSMNYEPVITGNQTNRNAVAHDAGKKTNEKPANKGERNGQEKERRASNKEGYATSTNRVSTVSPSVSATGKSFDNADDLPTDPLMPNLEDTDDLLNTGIFNGAYDDEDEGVEADLNNLETTMDISPIPITKIHKDHPKTRLLET